MTILQGTTVLQLHLRPAEVVQSQHFVSPGPTRARTQRAQISLRHQSSAQIFSLAKARTANHNQPLDRVFRICESPSHPTKSTVVNPSTYLNNRSDNGVPAEEVGILQPFDPKCPAWALSMWRGLIRVNSREGLTCYERKHWPSSGQQDTLSMLKRSQAMSSVGSWTPSGLLMVSLPPDKHST